MTQQKGISPYLLSVNKRFFGARSSNSLNFFGSELRKHYGTATREIRNHAQSASLVDGRRISDSVPNDPSSAHARKTTGSTGTIVTGLF